MKYFFVSDLHGTEGVNLITALYEAGFRNENDNHKVVVAGDITDGLQGENTLIPALMSLEKQKQLIAIKGNHDFGDKEKGYMNAGMNMPNYLMTDEQREWVRALPYQIETEHFYLAHGIYVEDAVPDVKQYQEEISIWGSPCLDWNKPSEWWGINEEKLNIIKDIYDDTQTYCNYIFDKDVYLGHFWPSTVKEKLDGQNINYEVDEKGFVSCGNVHWVDSDVLHAQPWGTVKVKVVEYE